MLRQRPYSLVSALMGCLFCVFTVGIPVVLASCPMTGPDGHGRASCCPADVDASQPVLRAYANTSCCTTRFVATRSTQEYLQSDHFVVKPGISSVYCAALLSLDPAHDSATTVPTLGGGTSPPLHRPLFPVFHSALLI
jgi:hypothetical protein